MYELLRERVKSITIDGKYSRFSGVKSVLSVVTLKDKNINKPLETYIVPFNDTPKNLVNDSEGSVEELTSEFGVMFGIQSINDPTGEKGNELLEQALNALRKSLLGYKPGEKQTACTLGKSGLLAMASNGIWWMHRFKTTQIVESVYDQ